MHHPGPNASLSAASADWYDPGTGRFLSQDPIGLAGGVNLYAYAGNNPASYSGPFGLCRPKDPTTGCTFQDLVNDVAGRVAPLERVVPRLAAAEAVVMAPMVAGMSAGVSGEVLDMGGVLQSSSSGLLRAGGVASRVASAVGGAVSALKNSEGFRVTVEGAKNIVARIKASGDMRVSIDRIGALSREGLVSADRALTHLQDLSSEELAGLVDKAKEIVGAAK